jgi:hypothetical protein
LDLAKYLGEGTSRKEAEEKSSAFFIFPGSDFLISKTLYRTDTIWRVIREDSVKFCHSSPPAVATKQKLARAPSKKTLV